jgi:hypothetical protein
MTTSREFAIFKKIELFPVLFLISLLLSSSVPAASFKDYFPVAGLIDLRTSFSDGTHSPEDLVTLARLRGFRVLFFNDHHRVRLSYGVPPFRNLLKYSKELPSIMTHGPQAYLNEIERLSRIYPDMILVPGSIISPFYYWTGSWLSGDLTVHQYDRKILALNLAKAEDYERVPNLESGLSLRKPGRRLPGLILFIIPSLIGLLLAWKWRGILRLLGIILVVLSSLTIIDYNPFIGSTWTPYEGDQGIVPFQETIDYLQERGALAFWNYPEQRSGVRKHGSVTMDTPLYPEVLLESKNYTGFAAIYGDRITATDPGKYWDRTLMEYCEGKRDKPVWGISTADFHEDGRLGLKLGAFPTTFLVREFSKTAILDAIKQGRMYCSRGDGSSWPQIDYFNVLGSKGGQAQMGETLTTAAFPTIQFRISYKGGEKVPLTIYIVRGGTVLQTFKGETPLECKLLDQGAPASRMTYYRLVDSQKHLTSNPIFVRYQP